MLAAIQGGTVLARAQGGIEPYDTMARQITVYAEQMTG